LQSFRVFDRLSPTRHGQILPPSIKVYPLDGDGDVKPLRVITGDKTLLDWPAAMSFDPDKGDLYIANDFGESILVFADVGDPAVQGDVAPTRIIEGPSTRLRAPTGIAVRQKNQEVWVSNLGNSSATVYPVEYNVVHRPAQHRFLTFDLRYGVFSVAEREKAAMCGWFTQLGTRIC
jgi:hypothetical protein